MVSTSRIQYFRFPLLATAIITMVFATWGGLQRIGWTLPEISRLVIPLHGPLMINGFLGTVIGIERAVASKYKWAYLAPAFTAIGTVLFFTGVPVAYPMFLISVAGLILSVHFLFILKQFPSLHLSIMTTGAIVWSAGNIMWYLLLPVGKVVIWWMGFLVLTIAGERLELSRILQPSRGATLAFLSSIIIFIFAAALAVFNLEFGYKMAGLSLLLIALWLFRHDLSWKSLKIPGLHRFIAFSLILGFCWLAIGGIIGMATGGVIAGPLYDSFLHAVFLGFVFSMIFGHAPIIFPSILNIHMEFSERYYFHLLLLHISLIIRILSDVFNYSPGRLWGAMFNGIAVLVFLLNTVSSIRKK